MKEIEFLKIIKNTLHNSDYLGDDCAYLKDLDIFVTQDTLVEDVHFSLSTTGAYDLGYKSVAVNLSDLSAAASKPLYITISLSLPEKTDDVFVKNFYKGVDKICEKYNVSVIGGDLTASDKVMISICAIGKKVSIGNVSRKNAKPEDIVVVTGTHGESAAGLKLFPANSEFALKHLRPEPRVEQGLILAKSALGDFAMMDSSDGLADALYKLAKSSYVLIETDFNKIPVNLNMKKKFPDEYKDMVLWGGEDFELIACIPQELYDRLDKTKFYAIGEVKDKYSDAFVIINDENGKIIIDDEAFNRKSFKHFED